MSSAPHILASIPKTPRSKHSAAPYEPVCAIFRRYLHEQKLKFTPERAMMLDAVLRKEGLFEPEQLVRALVYFVLWGGGQTDDGCVEVIEDGAHNRLEQPPQADQGWTATRVWKILRRQRSP